MHRQEDVAGWRAITSGLCASLVGIGLARFAYTPLIPALADEGWFAASDAAYLAAANLAGYLAGALLAQRLGVTVGAAATLRWMMLLATVSFFACAGSFPFFWFFLWRFAAGLAGGVLMVLAAPTVLPHVPAARRGLASGVIFTGVGLGIAASGTLVPLLMRAGLHETWLGLGGLSLVLTLVAWNGWAKATTAGSSGMAVAASDTGGPSPSRIARRALYVEYGLIAVGLVPHMVFLVDFIARGLGRGLDAGSEAWVLFGIGAAVGPLLFGHLADRIGHQRALRGMLLVQAVAVGTLAVTSDAGWLLASSAVTGASVPGVVSLVLGRLLELVPPDAAERRTAWGVATIAFAIGQAGAAYGFSYMFAATDGNYPLLFTIGAVTLFLALVIDVVSGRRRFSGSGDHSA